MDYKKTNAARTTETRDNKIFEDKVGTASFFFNRVLPRIDSHYKSATSGSKYIMDFKFS